MDPPGGVGDPAGSVPSPCWRRPGTAEQLTPRLMVVPSHTADYPREGSADEKRAREAIVRLLQTDSAERAVVIDVLAALINPKPGVHPFVDRKIVFAYRKEGSPAKTRRNAALCVLIEGLHEFVGLSYQKAYQRVADKHGLNAQTIKDLRRKWRKGGGTIEFPR